MEVHHHSHTPGPGLHRDKKWTHYFWEFLMLFLAVFCGFLAEYQLEHKIERDRAKELATSLYEELKVDSASIHLVRENRRRKESALNHVQYYLRDSNLTNMSKSFVVDYMYAFVMYSSSVFEPRNAILDQLRNSGSLRYFKSKELQKLVGDLGVTIARMRQRNEYEWTYFHENIIPFHTRHFDMEFYDKIIDTGAFLLNALQQYEKSNQEYPFQFSKIAVLDKEQASNLAVYYKVIFHGGSLREYPDYELVNHKVLAALRREFKIK